jgi:hypothetical protein
MKIVFKFAGAIGVALGLLVGGCAKKAPEPTPLDKSFVSDRLKHFIAEKKAQAITAAGAKGKELRPATKALFAAAEKGDWLTVSNIFEDLRKPTPQYGSASVKEEYLHGTEWEVTREIWGAFNCLASEAEQDQRTIFLGRKIVDSIPPGSIYFGGTDGGRWTVTALQTSHVKGDPFFTLTQNALSDPGYLEYLRSMYGGKIYIPRTNDSQRCFSEYMEDAQRRIKHDQDFPNELKQVKPGEYVSVDSTGHVQVSGYVTVMAINALLAKVVFDHETNREFYVEESFPLDWMYPHLEPHGLIMKIDREPITELSDETVRKDHEFWTSRVNPVIGNWLTDDTSVTDVCAFARKVYLKHDFKGFTGDRHFVQSDWSEWMSKLRSSLAGVYTYRLGISPTGGIVPPEYLAKTDPERQRMIKEADFAFRQAFALCPQSPEVVFHYVQFLVDQKRTADAIAVAEIGMAANEGKPGGDQFPYLVKNLKSMLDQESKKVPTH